MAAPTAVLSILVNANTGSATRGLVRVNQQLGDTEKQAGKTGAALKTMAKTGLALGAAGLVVGAKKSIDAATDLNEQINKTRVVFRGSEKDILSWSKNTAFALGISRREALEATGVFGNMLVPMGFARDRAGEMSVRMVKLAADMASFNNASPKETLDALRAGLAGETEPLRRFGVFLNDARLKQEAMNLGLKNAVGTNGALTANAKAMATYSVILKDTKDAQGDFSRTSGSLANQQRILRAQLENLAAKIGQLLIPAVTTAAQWLSRFIRQMETGRGAGGRFARQMTRAGEVLRDLWPLIRTTAQAMGAFAGVTNTVAGVRIPGFIQVLLRLANPITRTIELVRLVSAAVRVLSRLWTQAAGVARTVASTVADKLAPAFRVLKAVVNTALAPLRKAYSILKDIVEIGDDIAGVLGDIGGFVGGLPGKLSGSGRPLRDFIGQFAPFAPFTGKLGDRGAASVDAFSAVASRFGLTLTSGYRPGDDGWHGQNRARDYSGSAGSMIQFAQFMARTFGSRLLELIYTPLGFSIKNGQRTAPYAQADHFDHVHVAMQKGGVVPGSGSGDKVPVAAMLEPGERFGVLNRNAARAWEAFNGMFPRFQNGGMIKALHALHRVGATGEEEAILGAIAGAESGWAFRRGDGGNSITPWQIHLPSWGAKARQMGINLGSWGGAARMALYIARNAGYDEWTMYNNGQYRNFLDDVERHISGGKNTGKILVDGGGKLRGRARRVSPLLNGGLTDLNRLTAGRPVINVGQPLKGEGGGDFGGGDSALTDAINQQTAATVAHTAALNQVDANQKMIIAAAKAQGPALERALLMIVNGGIGGNAGLGRQFPSSIGLGGLSRA